MTSAPACAAASTISRALSSDWSWFPESSAIINGGEFVPMTLLPSRISASGVNAELMWGVSLVDESDVEQLPGLHHQVEPVGAHSGLFALTKECYSEPFLKPGLFVKQ